MKRFIGILAVCFPLSMMAQHKLQKIWQTDSVVAVPESVLADMKKNILYVSLIDGNPWDADGKGGIATLGTDGKNYNGTWISGLNAPKGLGVFGNRLYAADLSNVVVIDIAKGKVERKIPIPNTSQLNDITITDKGVVFVSDTKAAQIWKIENDKPTLFLENVQGANGLKAIGTDLIYAQGKLLKKANAQKQITQIAEVTDGIDGIEPVGNGDFIVSSWSGLIYYVSAAGKVETMLDTRNQKSNTADIGYDAAKHIVYVPTFFAKRIVAYKLN